MMDIKALPDDGKVNKRDGFLHQCVGSSGICIVGQNSGPGK